MKNLNIEGLQELEKSELENTNGGILELLAVLGITNLLTVVLGIDLKIGKDARN